jgi:hypothetical protein
MPASPLRQHHLSQTLFDLGPALQQQPHFLLATDEGCETRAPDRLQATAGHALIEDAVDRQRLGDAFQERGP